MKAAWFEKQGPAREMIVVGEMPDPIPAPGEVRISHTESFSPPSSSFNRRLMARCRQCATLISL